MANKMLADSMAFKHPALDKSKPCVRLIRFLPKSISGRLRFKLRNNVSLQVQPGKKYQTRFQALSYEWGSELPKRVIFINDKRLVIRENLFSFLQALYDYHHGRGLGWLWADAICIDQSNVEERNHQVQQMKAIYSSAKVLVWIRPASITTMPRVCELSKFVEASFCPSDMNAEGYIPIDKFCDRFRPHGPKALLHDEVLKSAVIDFYSCSYWNRLWIKQEIVLPDQVFICCDQMKINLRSATNLFQVMYQGIGGDLNNELVKLPWYRLYLYLSSGQRARRRSSRMLNCLKYFGDSICSKYHDKVYGLLGMIAHDAEAVTVDYGVPVERLFVDCLACSANVGDLYILTEKLSVAIMLDDDHNFYLLHRAGDLPVGIFSLLDSYGVQELQLLPRRLNLNLDLDLKSEGRSVRVQDSVLKQELQGKFRESTLRPNCGTQDTIPMLEVSLDDFREMLQEGVQERWLRCRCSLCSNHLTSTFCHTLLENFDHTEFTIRWPLPQTHDDDDDATPLLDTSSFRQHFMYFTGGKYLATMVTGFVDAGPKVLYWDPYHTDWRFSETPKDVFSRFAQAPVSYSMRSAFYALWHMFPANLGSLLGESEQDIGRRNKGVL